MELLAKIACHAKQCDLRLNSNPINEKYITASIHDMMFQDPTHMRCFHVLATPCLSLSQRSNFSGAIFGTISRRQANWDVVIHAALLTHSSVSLDNLCLYASDSLYPKVFSPCHLIAQSLNIS